MEELKQKLLNDCNESGLPLEALMFVVKDLWRDIQEATRALKLQQEQEKETTEIVEE